MRKGQMFKPVGGVSGGPVGGGAVPQICASIKIELFQRFEI